MSNVLIVLLLVGWGAVLTPIALQRFARRPSAYQDVARGLARIQRVEGAQSRPGAQIRAAVRDRRARKRRRDIFSGLVVTTLVSAVASFIPPLAAFRSVALFSGLLLVSYTTVLVSIRRSPAQARATVPADESWAYAYER